MIITRNWLFLALAGTLIITGCSKLDEMHDSTVSMDKKTSQLLDKLDKTDNRTGNLEKSTDRAAGTSEDILATARATYLQLRQGDSANIRRDQIEAMNNAASVELKAFEADAFYMAFEYQLKNITGSDTVDTRNKLYEKAVAEFFRYVAEYYSDEENISPTSSDNSQQNLYALALAMHAVNTNQEKVLGEEKFEPASMLSLIKNALAYRPGLQKGTVKLDDLPEYVKEVQNNEGPAVYLLRLRYNVLMAMVLPSVIPDLDTHRGFWAFIKRFTAKIDTYYTHWTPNLSGLNDVQIARLSRYLKAGLATRDFIASIGLDPKLDSSVRKVFKNGQLAGIDKPADQLNQRETLINEFATLFHEVGFPSEKTKP